ncbi:DUF417 family protein [Chitinophaga agrisoli]|uniref:DUF417 family protein n=1 Tax=Chitinophaga agrisoli TaxID=2607653 RepID=A0A5B2VVG8_9BACT|nr:DUF417 family protein [Chitinophaga agrisoli]KAA2242670.1 DUF417 family protein [Chitinophaga agrisoli]
MKNSELAAGQQTNQHRQHLVLKFSSWVNQKKLPFWVISIGMIVMLLWAGSYKMTVPGADGIVPLVNNSPLISWHFKLFGVYHGSDLIGLTEVIAAVLMIVGMLKPQAGIVGGAIAVVMFFVTSTMVITTPDSLVNVNGVNYMSFLGLFLYKDVINLGASLYLITRYGHMAAEKKGKH